MLSTKSEQFLMELRMYLIQKGKKDEDINEIVEELEVHLTEAEKRGESVDDIIGKSRKHYMKSIEKELSTDKEGLALLLPSTILVILAYMSFGPALSGEFKISQNILLFGSLPLFLVLGLSSVIFFKGMPKVFPSRKKLMLISMLNSTIAMGIWGLFFLWMQQRVDTDYFVASSLQNYLIAGVCIIIFTLFSVQTKSWLTIFVALYIGALPILDMVVPPNIHEDPIFITLSVLGINLIAIILIVFFYKKAKKENKII
ncbi:NADH dehydrogenase subunit [Bacillus carboniphilus]|uniref:NADH dehydrogenase subunit n=1 Tax=Bacillus carboniphilus TaxID=86663 RepID=A0ABY9JV32_9BACI|nr:NADH dehydrogenase subunit [Bacillus carboniphilus]WLR42644.1 NADH dehydrogenase subunit [Bacillus carboniphilus]